METRRKDGGKEKRWREREKMETRRKYGGKEKRWRVGVLNGDNYDSCDNFTSVTSKFPKIKSTVDEYNFVGMDIYFHQLQEMEQEASHKMAGVKALTLIVLGGGRSAPGFLLLKIKIHLTLS